MSVRGINWAFSQPVKPAAAKFILVALANYTDGDGYCWPGQMTLAEDTGQCDRSVRAHLTALEKQGLIAREERRRPNGSRSSDGYLLEFDGSNRKDLPVGNPPAGKSRQANRKTSPGVPENISAPEPPVNLPENQTRAREAAGEPNGPPPASAKELVGEKDTNDFVSAHWRKNRRELIKVLGAVDYRNWIKGLIPISDNGSRIVLGVRSKFHQDRIDKDYLGTIERILHRKIELQVHQWVKVANARAREG